MPKKMLKYFCFVLNKYQTVTHVSTLTFTALYPTLSIIFNYFPKHYTLGGGGAKNALAPSLLICET